MDSINAFACDGYELDSLVQRQSTLTEVVYTRRGGGRTSRYASIREGVHWGLIFVALHVLYVIKIDQSQLIKSHAFNTFSELTNHKHSMAK